MRDEVLVLSNSQTYSGLDSTGAVTDNVKDMEVDSAANALLTDGQLGCFANVIIISAPAQATIVGTEGVEFQIRTAAAAALTSLYEICGAISLLPSKIVTGAKFAVPCRMDVLQKFIGGWVKAVSTSVVGDIIVDIELSSEPISENESLQKVVA
jgi:hypothetical protein